MKPQAQKRVRKPNELTLDLMKRIEKGEERTTKEWAEHYFGEQTIKTNAKVTYAITNIRKMGIMAFALERGGVIKDVTGSEEEFNFVFNRYMSADVEPRLVKGFNYAEKLMLEHPKLRESVLARAKELIHLAAEQQKSLLGLTWSGKNGNKR